MCCRCACKKRAHPTACASLPVCMHFHLNKLIINLSIQKSQYVNNPLSDCTSRQHFTTSVIVTHHSAHVQYVFCLLLQELLVFSYSNVSTLKSKLHGTFHHDSSLKGAYMSVYVSLWVCIVF